MLTTMTQSPPKTTVELRGSEVRKRRVAKGKDTKSFAEQVGITPGYVYKLELGYHRRVSAGLFARIAEALGMGEDERRELIATGDAA